MVAADPVTISLIVLAVATVLIVQPYLLAAIAAQQAARAARRRGPTGAA
jgi:formate hydrogenlyase subunit 4